MTSASELFQNRRSRFGRNSLDQGLDRSFHQQQQQSHRNRGHDHHHHYQIHNNTTRRDRHDLEGSDPLRRPPLIRHHSNRPPNSEHDTVRHDEGSNQSSSGNTINLENLGGIHHNRRFSGNERLPGAVLLARERLLERLRGVSLSENRQSNRASSGRNRNVLTFGDHFRLLDAGDWETAISREWLAGFTDSISQTDQLLVPRETSQRPPGLTQEALHRLQLEVFSKAKYSSEGEMLRASQECSICLESFMEGDELICLPCTHRFHSGCLDPWVRTCGDCPYCRRGIVATSHIE
ncbi:putative E3 ubiquitin-protein ligase RHY1A [Camellia lanceoleosa]|uniref:E3 ubiquitin-protein ligase RHY1A n=1 Tax=Camellia lanceoleosa TaxID=1840588 RepID=A0ACC0IN34_9ERIC|nr:putative E3 ubiquitin-protein ligase RHY1A [Camellia lanceoleosa]